MTRNIDAMGRQLTGCYDAALFAAFLVPTPLASCAAMAQEATEATDKAIACGAIILTPDFTRRDAIAATGRLMVLALDEGIDAPSAAYRAAERGRKRNA